LSEKSEKITRTPAAGGNALAQFQSRLSANPRPVVVDFWAPWCGPCRAIEPALKQFGAEYAGRVDVWRINADDNPELLRLLRIFGIPTLIVFRGATEITRKTGAPSPQGLRSLFEAGLSGEDPGPVGIPLRERVVRIAAGLGLTVLALAGGLSGWDWLVLAAGGLVSFSAVHDRCPIWQALSPRLAKLLQPGKPGAEG